MKIKHIIILSLFLSGCATQKDFSQLLLVDKNRIGYSDANYETTFQFQFHGAASGLMSLGKEGLLMDPFVSNPPFADLLFLKKLTSNNIKERFQDLEIVKGIIVGHGHYDHLMDVPAVMALPEISDEVKVYTDRVSAYQIKNYRSTMNKIQVVDDRLDKLYDKNGWYFLPDNNIKIYPVRSEHAPNVGPFLLPFGTRDRPMDDNEVPRTFWDWKAGAFVNYAVVIKNPISKTSYRIYVQSSASDGPIGLPPEGMLTDIGGFDLVILSAAGHGKSAQYPSSLLEATKPDEVILIHWDSFFGDNDELKSAPGVDLDKLLQDIWAVDSSINVSIPTPGSVVKILRKGGRVAKKP